MFHRSLTAMTAYERTWTTRRTRKRESKAGELPWTMMSLSELCDQGLNRNGGGGDCGSVPRRIAGDSQPWHELVLSCSGPAK